jgi:hypothetical protein
MSPSLFEPMKESEDKGKCKANDSRTLKRYQNISESYDEDV